MPRANQLLFDEISKLSLEKVGKAISFIRFLEQEPDVELLLDSAEEDELYGILAGGETVDSDELLSKIKELPDD
jgi:hypothetical protein